ncbi:MAG: hypothetical protein U1E45_22645 [Geminicoccaceae bacterium]
MSGKRESLGAILWPAATALFCLFALLYLTVRGAFLPLGSVSPLLSFGIGAVKALIVLWTFMQLNKPDALLRLAATAGLFWLVTLFGLTFSDYLTRERVGASGPSFRAAAPPGDPSSER